MQMDREQTKWAKSSPLLRGAIVAMTRQHTIGINGGLPWHYSEDLKRFKARTMGCAVIMGRVTWDSINRKALPGRRNIVISRSMIPDVEHYHSVGEAIAACAEQDLWIIGGGQIYNAAMEHVNLLDLTYVPDDINDEHAVKFPPIDLSRWRGGEEVKFGDAERLSHVIYQRIDSDR